MTSGIAHYALYDTCCQGSKVKGMTSQCCQVNLSYHCNTKSFNRLLTVDSKLNQVTFRHGLTKALNATVYRLVIIIILITILINLCGRIGGSVMRRAGIVTGSVCLSVCLSSTQLTHVYCSIAAKSWIEEYTKYTNTQIHKIRT